MTAISTPVAVFTPRRGISSIPIAMDLNTMKLHHHPKTNQLPDPTCQRTNLDLRTADYQRQKIADQYGVSLSVAGILAEMVFSVGERRR
jgi:hypothetical protein